MLKFLYIFLILSIKLKRKINKNKGVDCVKLKESIEEQNLTKN